MDHEQVREAGDRHAQVGVETIVPLVAQALAVSPLRVQLEHRAADGVEARGEHEHVDRMLAVLGDDARCGERVDRVLSQVDE